MTDKLDPHRFLPNLPEAEPADVDAAVEELQLLDGNAFERAVTRIVYDPTPAEQVAICDPRIITKAIAACRSMIDRANRDVASNPNVRDDKERRARAEAFRTRMGQQRRLLEALLADMRAEEGSIAQTSLRARAKNEFVRRNPIGFLTVLRELEEQDAAERKARKKARKKAPERAAGHSQAQRVRQQRGQDRRQ